MLSVIMLTVTKYPVILSVILKNVIMLSVMAPCPKNEECHTAKGKQTCSCDYDQGDQTISNKSPNLVTLIMTS